MLPYWSLTYEVWYYAIFGSIWYLNGTLRFLAVAAICLFVGPRILALFPIWGLGVGAYFLSKRSNGWQCAGAAALAVFVFVVLVAATWGGYLPRAGYVERYLEGICFFFALWSLAGLGARADRVLRKCDRPIEWLAGLTFSLYLIHIPVAQFLISVTPGAPQLWWRRALLLLGTLVVTAIFAGLTERRKRVWRKSVSQIFSYLLQRRSLRA
jgi:peptidoglycan/LPS O-acetylase OafA/YrhL